MGYMTMWVFGEGSPCNMDNESSAALGVLRVPRLFPSLGPALLLAVGYIDPGKWAATVDGGARFGFDLVLLALAFNCSAILCQYLAARIGVVTGKSLAQIYKEEYDRPICIMLGVQAELSAIILELTMDKFRTDMLFLSISGSALLFYVLGVLISQPEIPLAVNGMFPRLRGESAYSLMSLLGASIMPHNFYLHSSIRQQEELDVSIGSLCHDHFFALVFTFSGIFLVNYVLIVSAATIFHNAGLAVLTFQDSLLLMDQFRVVFFPKQAESKVKEAFGSIVLYELVNIGGRIRLPIPIFRTMPEMDRAHHGLCEPESCGPFSPSPVAPLVLQVTALTWNLGGQVLLHDFFGISLPVWIHRITVKALAIIPALYCVLNSGPEGIYQLLIFSQILLAMLLPSSVIPLFRVASSGSIMGAFKIPWFMEILAFSAFLGMVAANLIFIIEMLFGDSDWISNVMWNMGSSMTLYILVLLTAFASVTLMLWLAATPLKSASDRPGMQRWDWDISQIAPQPSEHGEENDPLLNPVVRHGENEEHMAEEEAFEKSVVSHPDSSVTACDHNPSETMMESDSEPLQPIFGESCPTGGASLTSLSDESTSAGEVTSVATLDEVSTSHSLDASSTLQVDESKNLAGKTIEVDNVHSSMRDDDDVEIWEVEESTTEISGKVPYAMSEGSGSFKCVSGRNDDGGGGSGSLSRSSGLGRAARRQLAAILDEFWGQLYDYHGQLTQEAKAKRMDDLLGLDLKHPSSVKADSTGMEYVAKCLSEAERRSAFAGNPKDFDLLRQQRMLTSLESPYGVQLPSSSSAWSSYNQLLNAHAQISGSNLVDPNERRYSSLRLPSHSEDRDQQPATIHGYQRGSYLSRIAADRSLGSLNCPLNPSTPKSPPLVPRCRDSLNYSTGQNVLSSLYTSRLQNPAVSLIGRLPAERHYYDSSLDVSSGIAGVSTYSKKYHSSPDISDLIGVNRNSASMGNTQLNNPIGLGSFVGGKPYEQLSYLPTPSRTEGVPLAFDELSTPTLFRDPFSLQTSSSLDSNSLWSRQPFEQLFGIRSKPQSSRHGGMMQEMIPTSNPETRLLQSFRTCIFRLLKLEGSDWLFRQSTGSSGFDEKLIDCLAVHESYLYEAVSREANWKFVSLSGNDEGGLAKFLASSVPNCGEGCLWRASLIVSFGVWCIRRILELSVIESRPDHWGKYTYVLNRLQGIIDSAFFRPRSPVSPCSCLQMTTNVKRSGLLPNGFSLSPGKLGRLQLTTATTVLELIKDVEAAVAGRKGKTGTAAGDVAFPRGKENLASVLKRYKRRLSNKSGGTHEGGPSGPRKGPVPAVSFAL
ncbi:Ethylene-insensitive protein 2 [Asimina triloba]